MTKIRNCIVLVLCMYFVSPPGAVAADKKTTKSPPAGTLVYKGLDYTTLPEDPLEPVWDRLDRLSQEILKGFQTHMDDYLKKTKNDLEALNLKVSALEDKLDASVTNFRSKYSEEVSDQLSSIKEDLTHKLNTNEQLNGLFRSEITDRISAFELSVNKSFRKVTKFVISTNDIVHGINNHATNISNKLIEGNNVANYTNNCTSDQLSEFVNSQQEANCLLDEQTVSELKSELVKIRETPTFLPRDCSDQHWQHLESPSGVFQTFPTLHTEEPVSVWCDMGQDSDKSSGGWTVILRRRNTSWGFIDFNRTWAEYKNGFGTAGEGEWWYGLDPLHALTYRQPYNVQIIMHDSTKGTFVVNYTSFRVEDEAHKFRLMVSGFSGNVSYDAWGDHHNGLPFSTWDHDNDQFSRLNCARKNGAGWWFSACERAVLTASFPGSSFGHPRRPIRWGTGEDQLVLSDVTFMVRPAGYSHRFDAHTNK